MQNTTSGAERVCLLGTVDVGTRLATKVKVLSGAYAGRRGVVVRIEHGSVFVRLGIPGRTVWTPEKGWHDNGAPAHSFVGPTIPFARTELQEA